MDPPNDTHATALAAALRPSEKRGGAALVTGSTARSRRALLDDATRAFEAEHPRWLVARLVRSALPAPFADALTSAVDDALHAAHAPGALHDEGAGVASNVGSWLYRARAAGLDGLALVIDDLDAWLDARGATSSNADLSALLTACRRGPLAVLASTRAASASGAAALPPELLSAFDATVSLGGAPVTITRDPGTLVAALSGRSFNLGGLQASLAGWLDLPPPAPERGADDTLIVFSSPLAAPPLPVDPLVTLEWIDASDAPSKPAIETGDSRDQGEDVAALASGLRAAIELGTAVRRARNAPITDPASAERCFIEAASKIPRGLAAVTSAATSAGVEMRNLTVASHAAMARFDVRFESVLRALEEGRATATMTRDLPSKLAPLAARVDAKSTAVVALPGLRVDLWEGFKSRVLSKLTGLAPAGDEGVAWSFEEGAGGDVPASLDEAAKPRREHRGSVEVMCVGLWAAGLREGVTDEAIEAVEAALVPSLRALCGGFAGRTAVLFAGERSAKGDGAADRSAFAVLAPYGLYTYAVRNA